MNIENVTGNELLILLSNTFKTFLYTYTKSGAVKSLALRVTLIETYKK